MSPHRIEFATTFPGAWLVVASAISGAAAGFHGVGLFILLLVMGLDLLTGTRRARVNPLESYDDEKAFAGIRSKGRRIALVLLAFATDAMFITLSSITGRGEEVTGHCLLTGAAIGAQFLTEGYSVIDNVRRTEGKGVGLITAVISAAFRGGMQSYDLAKHEQIHGTPPPLRRDYDRKPEVVAEVVADEVLRHPPAEHEQKEQGS